MAKIYDDYDIVDIDEITDEIIEDELAYFCLHCEYGMCEDCEIFYEY